MSDKKFKALREHKFFNGMDDEAVAAIADCGKLSEVDADTDLATEGDTAEVFFILIDGRVAIDTNVPGRPPTTLQTVSSGDVIGWSWVGAREWVFDVRTLTRCTLMVMDADQVMTLLEARPKLGFEIMRRLNHVMTQRLRATRLQLLDIYGQVSTNE